MKKRKKSNNNLLVGLIIMLAAILIGAVIFLVVLIAGENDPQPTDPVGTTTLPIWDTGTQPSAGDNSEPTIATQGTEDATTAPSKDPVVTTEPDIKPTDPTVKPTDPTVKPTEPTAKPTTPTVKPTEPTAKPTEPDQNDPEPTQGTIPDVPTEPTTPPTVPEQGDEAINTPYCTLYYPARFSTYLDVQKQQGSPYTVTFISRVSDSKAARLFTIEFGGTPEQLVGHIKLADGTYVSVAVTNYEITADASWTAEEIQTAYAMQEELNYVLQNMPLLQADPEAPAGSADLAFETPYCTLHYPAKWDGYVTAEQRQDGAAYHVAFYGNVPGHTKQLLFTVHFNSDEGAQIAIVNQILVSLTVNELAPDASWSVDDQNLLFAMQEDMNYLITKLG